MERNLFYFLPFLLRFTKLCGRHMIFLSKECGKIGGGREPRMVADGIDRNVGCLQKIDRIGKTETAQIIAESHACFAAEDLTQIVGGEVDHSRTVGKRDRFPKMRLEIRDHAPNLRLP